MTLSHLRTFLEEYFRIESLIFSYRLMKKLTHDVLLIKHRL